MLKCSRYINALEERIATLELQLRQKSSPGADQSSSRLPAGGSPGRLSIGDVVNSLGLDLPDTAAGTGPSQFGLHLASNLGDFAHASPTGRRIDSDSQVLSNAPLEGAQKDTELPSFEIGEKLIRTYSERVDFRYPFLNLAEIAELHKNQEALAQIHHESLDESQRFLLFKLCIVYAIGSSLLALTDKQISSSMAEVGRKIMEAHMLLVW